MFLNTVNVKQRARAYVCVCIICVFNSRFILHDKCTPICEKYRPVLLLLLHGAFILLIYISGEWSQYKYPFYVRTYPRTRIVKSCWFIIGNYAARLALIVLFPSPVHTYIQDAARVIVELPCL